LYFGLSKNKANLSNAFAILELDAGIKSSVSSFLRVINFSAAADVKKKKPESYQKVLKQLNLRK